MAIWTSRIKQTEKQPVRQEALVGLGHLLRPLPGISTTQHIVPRSVLCNQNIQIDSTAISRISSSIYRGINAERTKRNISPQ